MDRRAFFGAAATALVVPYVPKRVYSFLWDRPLVTVYNLNGDALPLASIDVFRNGVLQQPGKDFEVADGSVVFKEPFMYDSILSVVERGTTGRTHMDLEEAVRDSFERTLFHRTRIKS